jgi:IS30 family transposase
VRTTGIALGWIGATIAFASVVRDTPQESQRFLPWTGFQGTAAETISAMLVVFGRIDPQLRRPITFDNDTAFAQHGLLRTMCDMTTWFCDA